MEKHLILWEMYLCNVYGVGSFSTCRNILSLTVLKEYENVLQSISWFYFFYLSEFFNFLEVAK